jgi:hypothetical protein
VEFPFFDARIAPASAPNWRGSAAARARCAAREGFVEGRPLAAIAPSDAIDAPAGATCARRIERLSEPRRIG